MTPEQTTTLEILTWDSGRLCVTGQLPKLGELFNELCGICHVGIEYWRGDSFTFSFPANRRREVTRLLEGFLA